MATPFNRDPFPGKPKILFIGLAQSTHTHAWIDLLSDSGINVRLFAMPNGLPPSDWQVKTYVNSINPGKQNSLRNYRFHGLFGKPRVNYGKILVRFGKRTNGADDWLSTIIRTWKPDIIHTLGLFDDQGGVFYLQTRNKFHLYNYGKWVLQLRGGSDMTLRRNHPTEKKVLQQALMGCDQVICDNRTNIVYASEMGIPSEKFSPIVPVPGSGGMDVNELSKSITMPSRRERVIVWPKAYECPWSKALPVLEAITIAWQKIKPCDIHMLAATSEAFDWYYALPAEIRRSCHITERIPRQEVFKLMKQARIMLAPSLIDGIPNCLYEAMACGAFPIVSPLETIVSIVQEKTNVLFARNLYPNEIADALIRAMDDDNLIDTAARNNLELVGVIADRQTIKRKVISNYLNLLER